MNIKTIKKSIEDRIAFSVSSALNSTMGKVNFTPNSSTSFWEIKCEKFTVTLSDESLILMSRKSRYIRTFLKRVSRAFERQSENRQTLAKSRKSLKST